MKIFQTYALTLLVLCLFSCQSHENKQHDGHGHHHHGEANQHMHESSYEELIEHFESKERDDYQQPDTVIAFLGDLSGKKIMDIGAGTGYFSFKLAEAGASVIAADVNDRFQEFIKERKEKLSVGDDEISLRKLSYDSPSLDSAEVDMVIIVNTYHHIEDRIAYFSKVKNGLKPDGKLVVIDFFKKDLPVGPPTEMKIAQSQVADELKQAGFESVDLNNSLLEYQFVLVAK